MICSKCGADAGDFTYCPQCGDEMVHHVICARCGTDTHGCRFCPTCGEKVPKTTLCTNCGADTQGSNFCPNCGQEVTRAKSCMNCGTELKDQTYCPNCGAYTKDWHYVGGYEARLTPAKLPTAKKPKKKAPPKPAPAPAPVAPVEPAEPDVTMVNDVPVEEETPSAYQHFRKFMIASGIANITTCLLYLLYVYLTDSEDIVLAYSGIIVFVLTFVFLPLSRVRKSWTLPLYSLITAIQFISLGFKIAVVLSNYHFFLG